MHGSAERGNAVGRCREDALRTRFVGHDADASRGDSSRARSWPAADREGLNDRAQAAGATANAPIRLRDRRLVASPTPLVVSHRATRYVAVFAFRPGAGGGT